METKSPNKKELIKEIKRLESQKDFDSMMLASQSALKQFPQEQKFLDLLHDAQAHYVDAKLESEVVKKLIEDEDYETLHSVYVKLLSVFPESRKLKKLLEKLQQKIESGEKNAQKKYYIQGENTIKELIQNKNYDDAMQAAYELLSYEENKKSVLKLLKKIDNKRNHQMDIELDEYFKKNIPELKAEYKSNKESFIKV